MKFKNIYTVAGLIGLFFLLQSKAGGPATQQNLRVTGAPGDGTCANTGCHTAGVFEPTLTIELLDGTSPVAEYEPGKAYTLKVTNVPGNGTPSRYGFQALALDAANAQAGDWGAVTSSIKVKTIANKKYIEHGAPSTSPSFELPWTAPATGTADVTFYAAGLSCNNNGQTSGDGSANGSLTVKEKTTSNVLDIGNEVARMEVVPNPVSDQLNLRIFSRLAGEHKFRIFSADGTVVKIATTSLQIGQNSVNMPVDELAPGLYLVQLCGDGHMAAAQMLKQ